MALTVQPAVDFSLSTLCDLINASFKGYVAGDIHFNLPAIAGFLASTGVNLTRSLVALHDGRPAGIAMLARRGWTVRVALMGISPEVQNQGVGRWLLGQIAEQAKSNGDRKVVLEVIEQNPRAVHLYESCGFRSVRRLMGYDYLVGENQATDDAKTLEQVDIIEAARHIAMWESPDLPWQCSGFSLVKGGEPNVAYRIGDCYAICSNPKADVMALVGLAVPPERQRQGVATGLVAKLIAAHQAKEWHVSPICPEEYGPIFLRNGFSVNKLNQFQMEWRL